MFNSAFTANASSLRRSSKLMTGGNWKGRTERPVRTRVVSTYLPFGSMSISLILLISRSVGCFALGG